MARRSESTSDAAARSDESARLDVDASTAGARDPDVMPDLDFVKGLIEAVDASGIDAIEITRAGTRVKISKTPPAPQPAPLYYGGGATTPTPTGPATGAGPAAAGPGGGAAAPAEPSAEESERAGLVEVTSPMVGTFYRAPAPDAPPYVEVGSKVTKGQTLCILEAMKLMNELEAEAAGVVREVLVENGEPVEYGQVLFLLDPKG